MTPAPTILKSSGTADFLASLPAVAGFTARNSVVVALFVGTRSYGALRIDLPARQRDSDFRALGDAIVDLASQMPDIDGVAPVVYTDDTFASAHGIPHLELWLGIEKRIRRSGLRIVDACCVAADGWASYLDRDRPQEGRPLALIRESSMALEAAFHAGPIPDLTELSVLPPADPLVARRVADMAYDLADFRVEVDAFGMPWQVELDAVALGEECVDVAAADLEISTLASIIAAADEPAGRDVMLLAMAFGREPAQAAHELNERMRARRAETGETFDEIVEKEFETTGWEAESGMLMLGRGTRPDADRLLAAISALRRAAAHAPPPLRAGVLCILAWMLWARGVNSAAGEMLTLAEQCDPSLTMVDALRMLLESGPPQWAFAAPPAAEAAAGRASCACEEVRGRRRGWRRAEA